MSNYHLDAVLYALKSVQLSGEPTEISGIYVKHLPNDKTLDYLVRKFGLTMKISKTTGRWIIERPWITKRGAA